MWTWSSDLKAAFRPNLTMWHYCGGVGVSLQGQLYDISDCSTSKNTYQKLRQQRFTSLYSPMAGLHNSGKVITAAMSLFHLHSCSVNSEMLHGKQSPSHGHLWFDRWLTWFANHSGHHCKQVIIALLKQRGSCCATFANDIHQPQSWEKCKKIHHIDVPMVNGQVELWNHTCAWQFVLICQSES